MKFNKKMVRDYNIFTSICFILFVVGIILDMISKRYGKTYTGYSPELVFLGMTFMGFAFYSLKKKGFIIAGIVLMSISILGYILVILDRNGVIFN